MRVASERRARALSKGAIRSVPIDGRPFMVSDFALLVLVAVNAGLDLEKRLVGLSFDARLLLDSSAHVFCPPIIGRSKLSTGPNSGVMVA